MNTQLIERAIIANRPGEPFVLVEVSPEEIVDLETLVWQADTESPTWNEVTDWVSDIEFADADAAALENIRILLQESDIWIIRAYEDGVAVSYARKQYRTALREAAASGVPSSVVLPEAPVFEA